MAFRAVFLVWHSELLFVFSLTFRVIMSFFRLAFKATFSIWHSESHFEFGVQSHRHLLSLGVQSPHLLSLGVQSHHLFSVSTFRATTIFSILAFKATISSQFRRSEPSSLLNYDVQCRPSQFDFQICQFSVMAFKAFIFFSLAFRAAILS